jgi:hypothetical protein
LHQPPWSFGFDSQREEPGENSTSTLYKVPGSLRPKWSLAHPTSKSGSRLAWAVIITPSIISSSTVLDPDEGCLKFCDVAIEDFVNMAPDSLIRVEPIRASPCSQAHPPTSSGAKRALDMASAEGGTPPSSKIVWSAAAGPRIKREKSGTSSASAVTAPYVAVTNSDGSLRRKESND